MSRNGLVIAIDGPAASGKSTTARRVAATLGYTYIDTGAMYRAVTLEVLRREVDPTDRDAVELLAGDLSIRFDRQEDSGLATILNGEDVSDEIRTPLVTANVSLVSSYPAVREAMVNLQKTMGEEGGVVLDGRDIGTVVFPNADVKVFMIADLHSRAMRRREELRLAGAEPSIEEMEDSIRERDRLDSTRELSPLKQAPDAVRLDTSGLTIGEQVDFVLELARQKAPDQFPSDQNP